MIPCKYCGGEGQVVDVKYKPGAITVQCSKCGARTEDAKTVKGLFKAGRNNVSCLALSLIP